MKYQRFLTRDFEPFDPLELARRTEAMVTRLGGRGLERKYTDFYSAPVYGGAATGYAVGCCLRCIYCWSGWSRDFPERYGRFYTPGEVARRLLEAAEEGIKRWRGFGRAKVRRLRISGCEPTIGKEHLIEVLENLRGSGYLFILETNGILLGADRGYVKQLGKFKDMLYVRVSFKAASPDGFTSRTGALGEYYELPFRALEYLLNEGIFARAAAMTDPTVMPDEERRELIGRLHRIDPGANYPETLEEERIDLYETSKARLKAFLDADFAVRLERAICT